MLPWMFPGTLDTLQSWIVQHEWLPACEHEPRGSEHAFCQYVLLVSEDWLLVAMMADIVLAALHASLDEHLGLLGNRRALQLLLSD